MTTEKLPPRLCHLRKRQDFDGYGFTLQAEKGKEGQFIGLVDEGSPAEAAGLKPKDKIIEVNGVSVLHETHSQVVVRIKSVEFETRFLVVDPITLKEHQTQGTNITSDMPGVVKLYSEPEKNFEYLARACHLRTLEGFEGYGFNLHYSKDLKRHVIGKVDEASPARLAGLLEGDIIIEVDGVNVESESHKDVVDKVVKNKGSVCLLVVGALEMEYFKSNSIVIGSWMAQLRHLFCPEIIAEPETTEQQAPELLHVPPRLDEDVKKKEEQDAIQAVEDSVELHCLRLCHLKIWGDGGGYGFNMQSEKKKVGQFISNVDANSPADLGGLKEGDLILAVNGTSVKDLKHQDVVDLIKQNPRETKLLLVDAETKEHFETKDLPLYDQQKMEEYTTNIYTPDSKPISTEALSYASETKVENKENGKPEVLLNVNSIQSSGIYSEKIHNKSESSAGSGEVPVSTKHVPSPTVVVGGLELAASAQEAKQRLAKKKQASQQMSVQARYELYRKL